MKKFFICRTEDDLKRFICDVYNNSNLGLQDFERDYDITINHTGSDENDTFQYIIKDQKYLTLDPIDFVLNDISSYAVLPCVIYAYYMDDHDRFGKVSTQIMDMISFQDLGIIENVPKKNWFKKFCERWFK